MKKRPVPLERESMLKEEEVLIEFEIIRIVPGEIACEENSAVSTT